MISRPIRRCAMALAVAALIAPACAFAQTLGRADNPDVPWFRVIAALLLCLGLAVAGAYVLHVRMRGIGAPLITSPTARRVQLIETLRLSHQVDVCLLRWGGEQLLVAASPQGVTILDRRPDVGEPTP